MAKRCSVCDHSQVDEINKRLIEGGMYKSVAREFNLLDWQAARNHHLNHIPKRFANSIQKKQAGEDLNMIKKCTDLMEDLEDMIADFKDRGKDALSLAAIDKLIKLYNTMANIASVYYQSKQETFQAEQAEQEQAEIDGTNKAITKLNYQELEWLEWLSYKLGEETEYTPDKPSGYKQKRIRAKKQANRSDLKGDNDIPIPIPSKEEIMPDNGSMQGDLEENEPEQPDKPRFKPFIQEIPSYQWHENPHNPRNRRKR